MAKIKLVVSATIEETFSDFIISKKTKGLAEKTLGSTAQFGKKSQAGFLFQFKVPKMEEYCMYFPFSELRKWSKKTAETIS